MVDMPLKKQILRFAQDDRGGAKGANEGQEANGGQGDNEGRKANRGQGGQRLSRVGLSEMPCRVEMEPASGIEPPTYGLRNRCSTTELRRL